MKRTRFIRTTRGALLATLLLAGAACGDDENPGQNPPGNGNPGGNPPPSGPCPTLADRPIQEISGNVTSTTWGCQKTYILTGLTYVGAGQTLTIAKGTEVRGDNGSALVVTRGGKIEAAGTADEPIVFTSSNEPGDRNSGDWGGLVLLGSAPINVAGGENQIEGIDPTENRGTFGGSDAAHDCGTLKYVRVEYGGFELSLDNELNGVTLGGCGSGTEVDYLQVHRGKDDGLEIFGGTVNVRHVLLSGNDDDSLDWDLGWQGKAEFVAILQNPSDADSGFESDNQEQNNDATPRSSPTLQNVTMVGTRAAAGTQRGMVLRRGTWGVLRNFIVTGFPVSGVDIRDAASAAGAGGATPGLTIENSLFFSNGPNGTTHFDLDDDADDDGAFDEDTFFRTADKNNLFDVDPELTAPGLVPAASGAIGTAPAGSSEDSFFTNPDYIGAFEPGGTDWTSGWTTPWTSFEQN